MIPSVHLPGSALVLEDVPDVADWLARLLGERFPGIPVSVADSLATAATILDAGFVPELALVDLNLPDGDGIELIARLSQQFPDCLCVVTTLFADDAHLFPALRAGAQGYLLKDQPQERLSAALEGILRGEPPLSPAIAQRLLRSFQAQPGDEPAGALTPREREVLVLVSKGCRLPELAEHLQISRHTVAHYLKSIYRKLNVNSRAEAALQAARMGLVRDAR